MDIEARKIELQGIAHPQLKTIAANLGVEGTLKMTKDELVQEIIEKEASIPPVAVIEAKDMFDAIQAQFKETYGAENGAMVSGRHYVRAMESAKCSVDLCWHEDLDEVQAKRSDRTEDHTSQAIAAISLCGIRGKERLKLLGCLRRAMLAVGFEVKFEGVTIL